MFLLSMFLMIPRGKEKNIMENKRFFIALSLYPLHFPRTLPLKFEMNLRQNHSRNLRILFGHLDFRGVFLKVRKFALFFLCNKRKNCGGGMSAQNAELAHSDLPFPWKPYIKHKLTSPLPLFLKFLLFIFIILTKKKHVSYISRRNYVKKEINIPDKLLLFKSGCCSTEGPGSRKYPWSNNNPLHLSGCCSKEGPGSRKYPRYLGGCCSTEGPGSRKCYPGVNNHIGNSSWQGEY